MDMWSSSTVIWYTFSWGSQDILWFGYFSIKQSDPYYNSVDIFIHLDIINKVVDTREITCTGMNMHDYNTSYNVFLLYNFLFILFSNLNP